LGFKRLGDDMGAFEGLGTPGVPKYQRGGVALHPQLAQVGEVPEAIIPLDQFSGLRGPQIIFNLSAVDGRNMERWLKATGAKAICEIVEQATRDEHILIHPKAIRPT